MDIINIEAPIEWQEEVFVSTKINNTTVRFEYVPSYEPRMKYIYAVVEAVMNDLGLHDLDKDIRIIIPEYMEPSEYEVGKTMVAGGHAHNGIYFYTVTLNPEVNVFRGIVEILAHELRHVWQYTQNWPIEWDKPYMERKMEKDAYPYGSNFMKKHALNIYKEVLGK